jgi:hypothetical protein
VFGKWNYDQWRAFYLPNKANFRRNIKEILRSMAEKGLSVGMLPFFKHGIKAHGKRSLP